MQGSQEAQAEMSVEDRLKQLNATQEGRKALKRLLDPLYVRFWTDVLNMAYEWFPHTAGDNSANERAFKACRYRVLRNGNQNVREMGRIIDTFAVTQLMFRQSETIEMPKNGPFQLPPGVKMPSSPNATVAQV